jgi:hypothetical protein
LILGPFQKLRFIKLVYWHYEVYELLLCWGFRFSRRRIWRRLKMAVFWDVAPCSLVEIDSRFRDALCLHHQGRHRPDDGGSKPSLKRLSVSTIQRGATSQKTAIFLLFMLVASWHTDWFWAQNTGDKFQSS